jgi:2-polyprenyl-6-hydroxyphenyl methylase/3-demethylubiquinone-9 3-methyltransferase
MKASNEIYEVEGHAWWGDKAGFWFDSLRYCINPVRYRYFKRQLQEIELAGNKMLDIGCGGGFLAEEFARCGFSVTGIDPAAASIAAAHDHACKSGLDISYHIGKGETLPFPKESFDIIACCDVLEHVDDVNKVLSEVARTLKPGGVFLFDTINRTWKSKLLMIKLLQDWKITRLCPPNSHVWECFIKPNELIKAMQQLNLYCQDMKGITSKNGITMLRKASQIRNGNIRKEQLVDIMALCETNNLELSYMGYSINGKCNGRI